ncbi:hypothetical protein [Baekduia sp.]|uniref:hypothetical protein n=1 Tax=Baekduia sp. TaxID=2600305 RepID=UPI002E1502A0
MAQHQADDLFVTRRGTPRLVRCAVLFIDLLGVRAMNRGPVSQVRRHLIDLDRAVTGRYRNYFRPESEWRAAFFSDTLVLAAPITEPGDEDTEIRGLVRQAAWLQLALSQSDFFVRGGLSLGYFHIRDGLIFGPALAEAYELESRHAVYPRVILSRDAEAAVTRPSSRLFCDGDGWTFINYLGPLFDELEDPVPTLQLHRGRVVDRLSRHRDDKRVWEKYRWIAEYHNAFVDRDEFVSDDVCVASDAMTWPFEPFA